MTLNILLFNYFLSVGIRIYVTCWVYEEWRRGDTYKEIQRKKKRRKKRKNKEKKKKKKKSMAGCSCIFRGNFLLSYRALPVCLVVAWSLTCAALCAHLFPLRDRGDGSIQSNGALCRQQQPVVALALEAHKQVIVIITVKRRFSQALLFQWRLRTTTVRDGTLFSI